MARGPREPIPAAPFLDWCTRREHQLAAEHDDPGRKLLVELGWDDTTGAGARRLYRWRHENQGDTIERAEVEDALHHAGTSFDDLYCDLDPRPEHVEAAGYCRRCRSDVTPVDGICPWCDGPTLAQRPKRSIPRRGQGRRMTDEQVTAAHVLYTRRELSLRELGRLLYERYGYANPKACSVALHKAFAGLGLPRRDRIAATVARSTTHGLTVGTKGKGRRPKAYNDLRRERRRAGRQQCAALLTRGTRCPNLASGDSTLCRRHQQSFLQANAQRLAFARARQSAGRPPMLTQTQIEQARDLHQHQRMGMLTIARVLIDDTPSRSPGALARTIRRELETRGWYRDQTRSAA